ncbi:protein argonaute 12-like [Grus japonensis]|uniref:Protein argonaute 12-like n=1 Tax=Grus japonensis TaxID=30415 RepID=A0ABC9WXL1_GRUJA
MRGSEAGGRDRDGAGSGRIIGERREQSGRRGRLKCLRRRWARGEARRGGGGAAAATAAVARGGGGGGGGRPPLRRPAAHSGCGRRWESPPRGRSGIGTPPEWCPGAAARPSRKA